MSFYRILDIVEEKIAIKEKLKNNFYCKFLSCKLIITLALFNVVYIDVLIENYSMGICESFCETIKWSKVASNPIISRSNVEENSQIIC